MSTTQGPMRVLYLDHTARLGGGELALARILAALGDRIDGDVVLAEDGPLADRLRRLPVRLHVRPMDARWRELSRDAPGPLAALGAVVGFLHYAVGLVAVIRSVGPDVVVANSLKSAAYGRIACLLSRTPMVWHARDRVDVPPMSRSTAWLVRRLAGSATAVIGNSRSTLDTLGLPARRPRAVLASPADVETIVAAVPDPRPSAPVHRIGMVGRFASWKGQDLFLEAFARAFPDGGEHAVLVGAALFDDEHDEAYLRAVAADLGIADRVEFRGFRDDVAAELARLDVLVHASRSPEPWGQVVVQGMAAGLPVVAADAGGPREIITHDQDGLLVAPGDADAYASALRRVADDPVLRARLSRGARRTAEAYRTDALADRTLTVYASLVPPRRRRR